MSTTVRTEVIGYWWTSDFGERLKATYDAGSPFGTYHVDSAVLDQTPGGFTYSFYVRGEQTGITVASASGGSTDRVRFDFPDKTKDTSFLYHLECRDNYYGTTQVGEGRIYAV